MKNFVHLMIGLAVAFFVRNGMDGNRKQQELPPGALVHVLSPEGDSSVTVFNDKIVAKGPAIEGGPMTMNARDITKVNKIGASLWITGRNGMLTLSFSGWGDKTLNEVEAAILEIRSKS